ncbi:MAG: tRNA-dihydrouridine synthase, partial [Gammaproteobacteria bacterium]|nr:tRNA-dihydrouridine synthase [Gammaproteobacteria bacterium]
EREGLAPRMKEPSAGEREGPAPRKQEPSAGERPRREAAGRGIAPRKNAARDFGALRDFVGEVAQAGVRVFIVHARKAVLQGLSPAQNRCVPELRPELVERLARELPHLAVIVNGGIRDIETAHRYLGWAAGIMVGRKAYQDPVWLSRLDADLCGTTPKTAEQVFRAYLPYVDRRLGEGVPLRDMTRHMLTLFNGRPGARAYRRHLSTHQRNPHANVESLHAAVGFVRQSTRWPPAVAAA